MPASSGGKTGTQFPGHSLPGTEGEAGSKVFRWYITWLCYVTVRLSLTAPHI
ncbi:hypothetical protein GQ43DRAFT_438768, partial [Delitschia confertaspora ATCC 74209]